MSDFESLMEEAEEDREFYEDLLGRGAGDPDAHGYPEEDRTHCPHCGASMKKYWHRLTPVLIDALLATYERVLSTGQNKVSKKDLNLSHSEYGNYQKLRFHALIARYKVDGKWTGEWLVTRRGAQFLKGEISVPIRVQTFRNKITDHDSVLVNIRDIRGHIPFTETRDTIQSEIVTEPERARAVSWLND